MLNSWSAVDAIRKYAIPEENEDYILSSPTDPNIDPGLAKYDGLSATQSNLRLFPPPIFSRQGIPQNYK